ncbi:hypothetical protein OUZ56_020449 [Daphnia magna]|uniref:Uncharacterized protein n=1 Tax=Daphnia magna TaxID=35525 RepID=A0ABQ9ZF86_9CRUS|nr:hypothetical protein OUZ56_020449 [Daphnia magna]
MPTCLSKVEIDTQGLHHPDCVCPDWADGLLAVILTESPTMSRVGHHVIFAFSCGKLAGLREIISTYYPRP